jgi:Prion-inhibition and propagation
MAELAALVIGGVSLATIFTTCIDCFEYVQIGRQFGDRYSRCLLQIQVLKLRLSQWAAAVNQLEPIAGEEDVKTVQVILADITNLFAQAENISIQFKRSKPEKAQIFNDQTDLEPDVDSLCQEMGRLALRRQQRAGFRQKTKWALYKHKEFDDLISAVTKHVESLEALYISVSQAQQQLRCEDAKALEAETELKLLEEVAEDVDPALEAAIRRVVADKQGHIYVGNTVTEDGQVQMGNYVAQVYTGTQSSARHLYLNNIVSGPGKLHMGDKYGGNYVLD